MAQTLGTRIASNSPDAGRAIDTALEGLATEVDTGAGAIAIKEGVVILDGTALAMTLAAPTAGAQPTGDDGKRLVVISKAAQAHTITTPSNKINGNKHIDTFAAVGDAVEYVAYGGVWYRAVWSSTTLS